MPAKGSRINKLYNQAVPRNQRERREKPDLVRRRHLCSDCHRQERTQARCLALHLSTDSAGIDLREIEISCALQPNLHGTDQPVFANQLNLFEI